jgi:hypothetical protein
MESDGGYGVVDEITTRSAFPQRMRAMRTLSKGHPAGRPGDAGYAVLRALLAEPRSALYHRRWGVPSGRGATRGTRGPSMPAATPSRRHPWKSCP